MDDMREFSVARKDDWKWTMMIMQPEIVTSGLFFLAVAEAAKKKEIPALAPAFSDIPRRNGSANHVFWSVC